MSYILVLIIFGYSSVITPLPYVYASKDDCYNAGVETTKGLGNNERDVHFTCTPLPSKTIEREGKR